MEELKVVTVVEDAEEVEEEVVETVEVGAVVNLAWKTGGVSQGNIDGRMTTIADVRNAVEDEGGDLRIAMDPLESQELLTINESICRPWREQDLFIYMVWHHA
jgi:hypothetical protein